MEDKNQRKALTHLDFLLATYHQQHEASFLKKLFSPNHSLQGIYIYGPVGRGKTILMDLFFNHLKTSQKKRVHFHAFMQSLHETLHEKSGQDIDDIAHAFSKDLEVLCLDEFFIDHISDAMLIARFLGIMFEKNVLIVMTSNCPPEDLYKGGFKRELFLPFLEVLTKKMTPLFLEGEKDYRAEATLLFPHWIHEEKIAALFEKMANVPPQPQAIKLKNRLYQVEALGKNHIYFSFEELCVKPKGPRDYLHLFHAFSTLFLKGIPTFTKENKESAKRFQNLIDVVYDKKITFWGSLAAHPLELFDASYDSSYERTASRLLELLAAKKE